MYSPGNGWQRARWVTVAVPSILLAHRLLDILERVLSLRSSP